MSGLLPAVTHGQHPDILVDVRDQQLLVNASMYLADFAAGLPIAGSNALEVFNPGYAHARVNALEAGERLAFTIEGPLLFAHGTAWQPADPTEYFRIYRPLVEDHSVVVEGSTNRLNGFPIARVDEGGLLHAHVRFQLGTRSGEAPQPGAYAVRQTLTLPGSMDSEPFLLLFNHSLETPAFIDAVVSARELMASSIFDCSGDGLLTTHDLNCVTTAEQRDRVLDSVGSVVGDFDGDGAVDFADYLTLSQSFGSPQATYAAGNIDLVGGVDFADFLLFANNFGFERVAVIQPVPEPSCRRLTPWIILIIAACMRRAKGRFSFGTSRLSHRMAAHSGHQKHDPTSLAPPPLRCARHPLCSRIAYTQ